MRWVAHLASLILAVLLASYGGAQDRGSPSGLAHDPVHKSETKPFNPHSAHAATPSNQPWFDLTGLPSPNRAADLGDHRYEITAANEEARAFFNQGLIYAYGFNHLEALRAFRQAQTLDPDCAMCFWGEAYVLGSEPEFADGGSGCADRTRCRRKGCREGGKDLGEGTGVGRGDGCALRRTRRAR